MKADEQGTTRRRVLAGFAAMPLLGLSAPRSVDVLYLGSWTTGQVYGALFDPATGDLTATGPMASTNSSWAVRHPTLPVLYVAGGETGGTVSSYRIDRTTRALTRTGTVTTGGTGTAGVVSHLAVDQRSRTLLVANFAAGLVASVVIGPDGVLGPLASTVAESGSGPNPRQNGPHPHSVVPDPTGRYVLVADFGADRVFVHPFDPVTRALFASRDPYVVAAGSGPRRLVFHPDGRTLYLMNELTADLQVLTWHPNTGRLTLRQTLPADPPGFTGTRSAAELGLSPDARFLYLSNRGENALQVYAVGSGLLSLVQRIPCAGATPWSFLFHPNGNWLFVANEASNTVNLFAVDRRRGLLRGTGRSIAVPAPDGITCFHR